LFALARFLSLSLACCLFTDLNTSQEEKQENELDISSIPLNQSMTILEEEEDQEQEEELDDDDSNKENTELDLNAVDVSSMRQDKSNKKSQKSMKSQDTAAVGEREREFPEMIQMMDSMECDIASQSKTDEVSAAKGPEEDDDEEECQSMIGSMLSALSQLRNPSAIIDEEDDDMEEEKEDDDQCSSFKDVLSTKEMMNMMERNAATAVATAIAAEDKEVHNDIYHSTKSRPVSNMNDMEVKPPSIQEPAQTQNNTIGKCLLVHLTAFCLFLS
jgi:hypothetical protein